MLSPKQAHIRPYQVIPSLPEPLRPLLDLAYDLWWSWHPEAVELFLRLDGDLWRQAKHNPVLMLGQVPQSRLEEVAADDGFLTSMKRVMENRQRHLSRTSWLTREYPELGRFQIAYFCLEFGLTECLQIYSGGLGLLAGDHLKSAAGLGLPLVAVGLLYRHGYFQQYLNADGWQQEYYPDLDFDNLPISRVLDDHNEQVKVSVQMPGRQVSIAVWKARVGRVDLYLLDTNLGENEPGDRGITGHLYGGDSETRIKQEIVLGIGGLRALEAVGISPDVCHMNEGHSAFLALERIRRLIDKHDLSFDEARQQGAAGNVFTTHTPVPAGIDRFNPDILQRYFKHYHPKLRLDMEGLLALGRENVRDKNEFFSMAILAIRTSDWANGVSRLHGRVSRSMWQGVWPGVPEREVPITHITNGVHARSWLSGDLTYMLDRYLGARWQNEPAEQTVWQAVLDIPDEELWRMHERRRQKLIVWTRRTLRHQLEARGTSREDAKDAADALNPNALTVGFSRRFATYKRGNLILRDPDRLKRMLSDANRPVQFIIAGKSHPADGGGKDIIRQIIHFARESDIAHKIVFLENYDIHVARYLVQGSDIWLNTPRRGMEASGTSGMKAAMNGVLNCSILDGWWDEAYDSELGWAIGQGETYTNVGQQDDIESAALYDLLENQIIPLFYDRDDHRVPRHWVARMKRCISTLAPAFSTTRMVRDYARELYVPAVRRSRMLGANDLENAVALAHMKDRLRSAWSKLKVLRVEADTARPLGVRDKLEVAATVDLGGLEPEEVRVQVYAGVLDNDGRITSPTVCDLAHLEAERNGSHRFAGSIDSLTSGRHGFAVRVVPGGEMFEDVVEPGLIHWDQPKDGDHR